MLYVHQLDGEHYHGAYVGVTLIWKPQFARGGMIVVSFRGVNYGWYHLVREFTMERQC